MSKRTATPALYEKMRTRPGALGSSGSTASGGASGLVAGSTAPSSRMVEPSPRLAPVDTGGTWLGPGRMLRMPVGYVLLAAAATLAIVIVTYMFAFKRGQTVGKSEIQSQMISDLRGAEPRVTTDPLVDLNPAPGGANSSLANNSASRRSAGTVVGPQARSSSAWGAMTADPRKKGLNYFVVVETQETGAKRIAAFCRNNGLETYVIPGKNDRLRRVIVLPGFESGARSSPEVKSLEQKMQDVGDKWKKAERGNSDFRGAYPSLYNG